MGSWMDFVLFCRVSKVLTTYTYTFVAKNTCIRESTKGDGIYIYILHRIQAPVML